MIPLTLKPEPPLFNDRVRIPGQTHLQAKGINISLPLPSGTKITAYWTRSEGLDELYKEYNGVCAYLAVHFERIMGGATVDHYLPKALRPDLAYEWDNYRLSSSIMNSRKNDYLDVIDPFSMQENWFYLELTTGRIYPNPNLNAIKRNAAFLTINRLKLDEGLSRKLRTDYWDDYILGDISNNYLQRKAPFVWYEANRQGLL
jgi:hypothetical protein